MYMVEIKVKFVFSYTVTEDCFTRQGVKMNKSVANGTFLGICCTHSVVHTVLVTVCVIIGCLDVYTLAKTAINMDACSVKMVSVDVDTCLFIGTNVI